MAVEGEEFCGGAANFATLVFLDGFYQRLELTGLGHREQQAQAIVSVLSIIAGQIFNGLSRHSRFGQGSTNVLANPSAWLRRAGYSLTCQIASADVQSDCWHTRRLHCRKTLHLS